ncbi:hypothetical protein DVH24_000178 [Malus domestica]|uniref:Pentacotripeptide-repeat region of PRORP domain-containing protein n=1 Tax=Malus domestica TaxID=3750 RepID=A0A498IYV8_MALDO|nr:hypothetical protein DVH24_000178 [Malus domestica]
MKKIGCTPDMYAYNALMPGMMRTDMIDEAHSLLKVMEENDCIPDLNSHNIIFNGLARMGGPNQALEMFAKTKHSKIEPDAVTYNTILGCKADERDSTGFEYDLNTYSSILEAVGKVDDIHKSSLMGPSMILLSLLSLVKLFL